MESFRYWHLMDEHDGDVDGGGNEPEVEQEQEEVESEEETAEEVEPEGEVDPENVDPENIEAEPEYTPNFAYKASGEDHEFDEWVRPFVNKETEGHFRELFEKAKGIDSIKAERDQLKEDAAEIYGHYENAAGLISEVVEAKKVNDLGTVLKMLKIDEKDMAAYLIERANIEKLSPEERRRYDEVNQLRTEVRELKRNNQGNQSSSQKLEQERLDFQLSQALSSPHVKETLDGYDQRFGKGEFRNEVIRYALAEQQRTGKSVTPEDAVKATWEKYSQFMGAKPQDTQPRPGGDLPARKKLPTVPKVKGTGKVVTGKQPNSIEDIRKMSEQMALDT